VDDLERMSNDANGKELLSVVAALHHQAIQHEHISNVPVLDAKTAYLSTRRSTIGI